MARCLAVSSLLIWSIWSQVIASARSHLEKLLHMLSLSLLVYQPFSISLSDSLTVPYHPFPINLSPY